jgi:hypothetical protein
MKRTTDWRNVRGVVAQLHDEEIKGYYIDLFDSLSALLSNASVFDEVKSNSVRVRNDDIMVDLCDGSFHKNHPLYLEHPLSLQIMLYYDDLEVCNPLGSCAGIHKLGVFYYSLCNIRPQFRSRLPSVQLLALAYANDIHKYGVNELLGPFVEQMKLLGSDNGVQLNVNGNPVQVHGAVLCVCGDTPASNFLGGFKEGVGYSLRKCQCCLAVTENMRTEFHSGGFITRDKASHDHHCTLIEGDVNGRGGFSTTYGINNRSLLCDLPYFDVTKCLPYDIMHTLFEGVGQHTLNCLYKHLVDDGLLSLDSINRVVFTLCSGEESAPENVVQEGGGDHHLDSSRWLHR